MFVGPVFQREVIIAPRRARIFIARTAYVAVLLLLIFTAWMVLYGTQNVQDIGDLARFGTILFQILAPLQLVWAAFFSAMLAAAAVAHEKDRRTLILLLLTNLSNSELVLGKLLASILNVLVMLAAAFPLFMAATLLGGISLSQIAWTFAITLTSVLACGSLGSLLALRRKNLPGPGTHRLGPGPLGGRLGNRGRRRTGRYHRRHPLPGLGQRNEPVACHTRSHPTLHPHPACPGRVGQFDQSLPAFLRDHRRFAQRNCHSHGPRLESIPRIGPGTPRGIFCAAKKHLRGR